MKGEPLIRLNGWCLVDAKNVDQSKKKLIDGQHHVSFMWHECEALVFEYRDEETDGKESEIRYLDAEDSVRGKCWYCMAKAPHDLYTVWTIHNLDIIHQLSDPPRTAWTPEYIEERIRNIESSKEAARRAGWYDE